MLILVELVLWTKSRLPRNRLATGRTVSARVPRLGMGWDIDQIIPGVSVWTRRGNHKLGFYSAGTPMLQMFQALFSGSF